MKAKHRAPRRIHPSAARLRSYSDRKEVAIEVAEPVSALQGADTVCSTSFGAACRRCSRNFLAASCQSPPS